MGWKNTLQLGDIDLTSQRLEAICKVCCHLHYIDCGLLLKDKGNSYLYLNQLEQQTGCQKRGCRGGCRLMLVRRNSSEAFRGGLA